MKKYTASIIISVFFVGFVTYATIKTAPSNIKGEEVSTGDPVNLEGVPIPTTPINNNTQIKTTDKTEYTSNINTDTTVDTPAPTIVAPKEETPAVYDKSTNKKVYYDDEGEGEYEDD